MTPVTDQAFRDFHARAMAEKCRDDLGRLEARIRRLEDDLRRLALAFSVMVVAAAVLICAGYVFALITARAL